MMLASSVTHCVLLLVALLSLSLSVLRVTGDPGPGSSSSRKSSSSRSGSSASSGGKMTCEIALKKCTVRMSCGMALHDYRISCKQELYGVSKNCSELCQLAIISLASTPEGHDYLNCDCDLNDYCKLIRQRTEICKPKRANNGGSKGNETMSCKTAELYCKADELCVEAWNYYKNHCSDMLKGRKKECSRRCNNTVSLLWKQRKGISLRNCTCDRGDSTCRKERESTMRLCYGLKDYKAYTSHGALGALLPPLLHFALATLSSLFAPLFLLSIFSSSPTSASLFS